LSASTPIRAFAAPPWFSYEGWQHAPVLISTASNYISCHRALYNPSHRRADSTAGPIDISDKTETYRLVDHLTEEVIGPQSLAFASDGKRFLAGSKNQISLFDREIEYGPIEVKRTIPSVRNTLKGGGVGYKGTISALAMAYRSNMFAAGSWSSHVGLYRLIHGGGIEEITHFPLPRKYNTNPHHNRFDDALRGEGVTQLKFSPCENYVYIAERHSDSILVYDVRNVALSLSYCAGRNARTVQKLAFDIFPIPTGPGHLDLWAGGVDGVIRIWNNPHLCQGAVRPCTELAMHQDPVSGVMVHPLGGHLITATGRIEVKDTDEDSAERRTGIYPRKTIRGSLNVFQLASGPDPEMG
jgi:WD40 repeat protein